MAAERNKDGLIVNVGYAKEEVRRPIMTNVVVERVESLPGATAGAGNGDFHQYRNMKTKEEARLVSMELEYRQRKTQEEFDKLRTLHQQECIAKTSKKSLKRKKKKQWKQQAKAILKQSVEDIDICVKKPKIEPNESNSNETVN